MDSDENVNKETIDIHTAPATSYTDYLVGYGKWVAVDTEGEVGQFNCPQKSPRPAPLTGVFLIVRTYGPY